jgi:adenylyltransferase/sulfurtransferase
MSENRENIQLVDVREQNESPQIEELIEINIPLVEIIDKAHNIDRNKKVIIFCKSGVRSAIAIQLLQKKFGMKNLFTLKGGVNEWLKILKKTA